MSSVLGPVINDKKLTLKTLLHDDTNGILVFGAMKRGSGRNK